MFQNSTYYTPYPTSLHNSMCKSIQKFGKEFADEKKPRKFEFIVKLNVHTLLKSTFFDHGNGFF